MRLTVGAGQAGSTLIEGLIAVAIFSFGMLGIAAFQLRMSAASDASRLRTQAVLSVEQLVAAAQADAPNAGCYAGRAVQGQDPVPAGPCGSPAAAAWFAQWAREATAMLPQGEALVTYEAASARLTAQLAWSRPGADTQNVSMATQVQP
jgi:type IV pilus assembly protein PilV